MEDGLGTLIGGIICLAIILFIIYCIVIIAGMVISAAGVGGALWGGGTAFVNYMKSLKENLFDSNRRVAV